VHTDPHEHATSAGEAADEQAGVLGQARARAIVLATAGGADAQILAALRAEYCACRPQRVSPSRLGKSFATWIEAGDLDDARQAGELAVLEQLQKTAVGDEPVQATRAAIHLDNRRTKLEGADAEVLKVLRELLALPEAGLVQRLEETLGTLKGRQARTG
jgi:hypothetical protein